MDIQSATSSLSAYSSQLQQTQQIQQASQLARQQPKPEERVELQEAAPPPVTNAQGQRTGTVISVTA